jgi:hypothetical protein
MHCLSSRPATFVGIAALASLGALAGCSQASDDAATSSQDIFGYLDSEPNEYNTRLIGTVAYGQTLTSLSCVNPSIRNPSDTQWQPRQQYCAVKFIGNRFDKVHVTVSNTDNWATDQIEAYLFDGALNPVHPGEGTAYATLDKAKWQPAAGAYDGRNSDKPVELALSPGRQLQKTGTYYVVFTKYAIRDSSALTRYKDGDAFSVRLDAVRSSDLPLSLEHPPVRSGLYTSPAGDFVVDVVPPQPESVKDFGAWTAHVYAKRDGCMPNGALDNYVDVDCDGTACWFYANKHDFGGGAYSTGDWYLRTDGDGVSYAGFAKQPAKMRIARETSTIELRAYETGSLCKIQCPPPPPVPPYYDNPCVRPNAPGWCAPDWPPPYGFQSPLVFNLSAGNGIEFLGRSVPFNLDGKGARPLDWVAPAYPFLALDANGNGLIDDGTELFGTATLLASTHQTAKNGFAALAQYDDNHDNRIDAKDAIYARLLLWSDANSNGVSEPTELSPLSFSGVDAINLNAARQPAPTNSPAGGFIAYTSSFEEHVCRSAVSMFVADVWFPTTK